MADKNKRIDVRLWEQTEHDIKVRSGLPIWLPHMPESALHRADLNRIRNHIAMGDHDAFLLSSFSSAGFLVLSMVTQLTGRPEVPLE